MATCLCLPPGVDNWATPITNNIVVPAPGTYTSACGAVSFLSASAGNLGHCMLAVQAAHNTLDTVSETFVIKLLQTVSALTGLGRNRYEKS